MVGPGNIASTQQSRGRRFWNLSRRYPEATAIGVYALLALAATIPAYFHIFTQFASYDDEGTLLVGVKAFADGQTLYSDIWSVYGPFYYELFGGLFALTGHPVTTDASRSIVIVLWVGTSLLFGIAAQRLTGRLLLGAGAMVAAFAALGVLANEPMHPHGLCVLLLGAFSLVAVFGPTKRVLLTGALGGALLAALVLTKVNLGVYAIAAIVLAAALTLEPVHRRRWLRRLAIAGFLLLPVVVLERDLSLGWVRELLLLEVLAATALIVASRPLWPPRGEDDGGLLRWLLAAAAGFIVAFVAILAIILLTGPSPGDVYDGMVKQAFGIRDVLLNPYPFPAGAALDWAIIAVVAAALVARLRRDDGDPPSLWSGLLRVFAGLVIWLSVAHIVPVALSPSTTNPVILPMLLAWLAVIPPTGLREAPWRRFVRVLLPALAIAETLQAYPVPGSQLGIASVCFVLVGALCFADALTELRAWSAAKGEEAVAGFRLAEVAVTTAAVAILALNAIILPAGSSAIVYRDQQKLLLPGAGLMRLQPEQAESYAELVDLLHRNGCTTFVSFPAINSLYLWSGLEPVAPLAPNGWMYALDNAQQRRAVEGFRASPRPCAIRNEAIAASYLKGMPPPDTPLVNYVFDDFKLAQTVGPFEFLLPKRAATRR
ncbi:MAG TPA: hypothetical protein VGO66_07255 [Solirubrobacterales bacterium]|jgi:hypothetical protein|nr:hypothetical protein [Solirubrobacterales bacterium]